MKKSRFTRQGYPVENVDKLVENSKMLQKFLLTKAAKLFYYRLAISLQIPQLLNFAKWNKNEKYNDQKTMKFK